MYFFVLIACYILSLASSLCIALVKECKTLVNECIARVNEGTTFVHDCITLATTATSAPYLLRVYCMHCARLSGWYDQGLAYT